MNIVAIGWQLGDLSNKNFDDIKKLMNDTYQDSDKNSLSAMASQVNKFVNDFKINDYVISYNPFNRKYYIGKIISDYYLSNELTKKYNEELYPNFRNVNNSCIKSLQNVISIIFKKDSILILQFKG